MSQAKRTARQLLLVFPELLKEVTVSWKENTYSSKGPIQDASSLDFEDMEKHGMAHMPPIEPLVSAHITPKLPVTSFTPPSHSKNTDSFQSAMTEQAYKAVSMAVRALNITSMLAAYQAEIFEDMSGAGQLHVG